MVIAIPYPASALPFTVLRDASQKKIPLTAATSLSGLGLETYFYDSASQHVYVYLENWSDGREVRYQHQSYPSWGVQVEVQASCGSACTPTTTGMIASLLFSCFFTCTTC